MYTYPSSLAGENSRTLLALDVDAIPNNRHRRGRRARAGIRSLPGPTTGAKSVSKQGTPFVTPVNICAWEPIPRTSNRSDAPLWGSLQLSSSGPACQVPRTLRVASSVGK